MDIEQQIGRLFMVGFYGDAVAPSHPIVQDIRKHNLGGVILFDRFLADKKPENNIRSLDQVRQLTADLQDAAHGSLLIGVDQEGGRVSRFSTRHGFPETPPARELGSTEETEQTACAAKETAGILAEAGITINLAPVTDLDSYPENPIIGRYGRSFSAEPARVARHARVWIEEHHRRGIKCCLKHFPGHGSSRTDSHLGFVDISDSWREEELEPYRILLKNRVVDAVMTGHLFHRDIDSEYPATLSAKAVSLLRDQLGFSGPVLTDDMQMRAITARYGLAEGACLALAAGADLVIVGNNLAYDPAIVEKLTAAAREALHLGFLTEQRIAQAAANVDRLRPLRN